MWELLDSKIYYSIFSNNYTWAFVVFLLILLISFLLKNLLLDFYLKNSNFLLYIDKIKKKLIKLKNYIPSYIIFIFEIFITLIFITLMIFYIYIFYLN